MKNYAFCVDSDGCVMDTMTPKHRFCFGPEAIKCGIFCHGKKKPKNAGKRSIFGRKQEESIVFKGFIVFCMSSETRLVRRTNFPGWNIGCRRRENIRNEHLPKK